MHEDFRPGLEVLLTLYRPPLYAYVRQRVREPEAAEDLIQEFLIQLMEKGFLNGADKELGRFRTFLLGAVRNFVSSEWRRSQAEKRGGKIPHVRFSFPEEVARLGLTDTCIPELAFERGWANTVIDQALEHLRAEWAAQGKSDVFRVLQPFLPGSYERPAYKDVAEALGVNESAVKAAIHRLRRQFGQALRERVRETLADPMDLDDEIRHLIAVVSE